MKTLDEFIESEQERLNHICIFNCMDIGRLVGFAEDGDDFYYVVRMIRGRSIQWISGACSYVSLKEEMTPEHYSLFENVFSLNGITPVEQMITIYSLTDEELDSDPDYL